MCGFGRQKIPDEHLLAEVEDLLRDVPSQETLQSL